MEKQEGKQRQPSGNMSNYSSIQEKIEKCQEMAGYNESLKPNYYRELNKKDRR